MIGGVMFNVALFYYLQWRRQVKQSNKVQEIMDASLGKGLIHVDNHLAYEMNLSTADLEGMMKQPDKYILSNHLRNKVLRERKRLLTEQG